MWKMWKTRSKAIYFRLKIIFAERLHSENETKCNKILPLPCCMLYSEAMIKNPKSKNIHKTCKTCGKLFKSGPTGKYCNECFREIQRYRKYEIDSVAYQEYLIKQDNKCAICQEPFKKTPHIDHDHKTGIVRGLLCVSCNHAIGLLKDSTILLKRAAIYLMGETEEYDAQQKATQEYYLNWPNPWRNPDIQYKKF